MKTLLLLAMVAATTVAPSLSFSAEVGGEAMRVTWTGTTKDNWRNDIVPKYYYVYYTVGGVTKRVASRPGETQLDIRDIKAGTYTLQISTVSEYASLGWDYVPVAQVGKYVADNKNLYPDLVGNLDLVAPFIQEIEGAPGEEFKVVLVGRTSGVQGSKVTKLGNVELVCPSSGCILEIAN